MTDQTILEQFRLALTRWRRGFKVWAAIYYGGNALTVGLPIFVVAFAASYPSMGFLQNIILGVTSATAAILTILQPGAKASSHKLAYLRLRTLIIGFEGQMISKEIAWERFEKYSEYLSYSYTDLQQLPNDPQDTSKGR